MNHIVPTCLPLLLAAGATAQTAWTDVTTTVHPAARYASAMTYDSTRLRCVLFGGDDDRNRLDDTWMLRVDDVWTQASPSVRPPARRWHALAFDPQRHETVLFGGDDGTVHGLDDTWVFGSSNWVQRFPMHRPPARYGHAMVHDPIRRRIVMLGGRADNTLWTWSGTDWTAAGPAPGRMYPGLAFDEKRDRLVVFGGSDPLSGSRVGGTMEHDGTSWTQVAGTQPPPRVGHAMVYDPLRECVVMAGGRDTGPLTDTWEFRDGAWTLRAATLSSHYAPAMAFAFGRTNLFGGGTFPGVRGETWRYDVAIRASYSPVSSGCGSARLSAAPAELPYVGTTFVRQVTGAPGSFPMFFCVGLRAQPVSLTSVGMPGCTLVPENPAVQVVFVTSPTVAVPLPIPNDPALAGVNFHDQALIVESGANAIGVTLTNAQRGTTRLP